MTLAVEDDAIGAITQTIDGGGAEQLVGEGGAPFVHIEIAGDNNGAALVAFGDQVMEVLVLRRAHRPQTKVVEQDQLDAGELLELALVGIGGARGMQLTEQLGMGGEEHFVALAQGAVAERLRQMTLAGAGRTDEQDRGVLGDEAAGCQIGDLRLVDRGVVGEVETLEGLVVEHLRPAQPLCELPLVATSDFILDDQSEEVGKSELGFNRLPIARLQRIEDAGQAQLLEQRDELR